MVPIGRPRKRDAKTPAERAREYRERKAAKAARMEAEPGSSDPAIRPRWDEALLPNGPVKDPKLAIARSETTDPTQTETWEGIDMDEAYRMGLRGEDVPRAEPDDDHPEGLCVWSNSTYAHLEIAWAEGLRVRHGAREQAWRIAAPDNVLSEEQRAENAARYEAWWNSPTERAWRASYDARMRARDQAR